MMMAEKNRTRLYIGEAPSAIQWQNKPNHTKKTRTINDEVGVATR